MCKCGCDKCETVSTALMLNESKAPRTILSEGLKHHIDANRPLTDNFYSAGSKDYFDLIAEARSLYSRGILDFTNKRDIELLTETDQGYFGIYEGKKVPLDFPMLEEEVINENNLLKQAKLSSEEYQKAKKLKDFNKDDYEWNSTESLYVKEKKSKFKKAGEASGFDMRGLKERESDSKYPDFDLDKNIKYQDTSISSGMWRYTGKEQGGKGVYRNLMNDQFLGFSSDDFDFFKKHLGSHFDMSESLNEAKKKKEKKDPPIGKPKRGGSKAYYVYVRDPKTKKVKKVSFGSGGLRAKIRNPKARKAFAARHKCSSKKDRTKAGYWSCNLPRYAPQLGLGAKMNTFW